jgi:hypothetical protein
MMMKTMTIVMTTTMVVIMMMLNLYCFAALLLRTEAIIVEDLCAHIYRHDHPIAGDGACVLFKKKKPNNFQVFY